MKLKKLFIFMVLVFGLNVFGISPIKNSGQFTEKNMIDQKWNWSLPIHIVNNMETGEYPEASIYFNYKKAKDGIPKVTLDVQTKKGYKEIPIIKWPLTLNIIKEAGIKAGVDLDFKKEAISESSIGLASSDRGIIIRTLSNGVLNGISENEPLNITKIYQGLVIEE